MKKFCEFFEITIGTIGIIVMIMAALYVFGLVLRELAPIITILVVLFFTLHSFEKRATALLAIIGILFYAVSWYAVHSWGATSGQLICFAGILFWLSAVFGSFERGYASVRVSSS
jgi:predicted membrane protein